MDALQDDDDGDDDDDDVFMMSVIRWMHFKTVHVNTGWMTTADETGDP